LSWTIATGELAKFYSNSENGSIAYARSRPATLRRAVRLSKGMIRVFIPSVGRALLMGPDGSISFCRDNDSNTCERGFV
jgi:hypothetical protein